MKIKNLDIKLANISKTLKNNSNNENRKKQRKNRFNIDFQKIGYCRLRPVTDPERLKKIREGMAELPERIEKNQKNKLKTKNALSGEFSHVHFE